MLPKTDFFNYVRILKYLWGKQKNHPVICKNNSHTQMNGQ